MPMTTLVPKIYFCFLIFWTQFNPKQIDKGHNKKGCFKYIQKTPPLKDNLL